MPPGAGASIFATWRGTEFRLPGAIIRITEHGRPEAHVGRMVSYSVVATGVPPKTAAH